MFNYSIYAEAILLVLFFAMVSAAIANLVYSFVSLKKAKAAAAQAKIDMEIAKEASAAAEKELYDTLGKLEAVSVESRKTNPEINWSFPLKFKALPDAWENEEPFEIDPTDSYNRRANLLERELLRNDIPYDPERERILLAGAIEDDFFSGGVTSDPCDSDYIITPFISDECLDRLTPKQLYHAAKIINEKWSRENPLTTKEADQIMGDLADDCESICCQQKNDDEGFLNDEDV